MTRVGTVALNTFREAVRDRVLYNLVFFALVMMAAAILVGQISIGIEEVVIVSLGLSAISIIGLLIAVFIGVGLVSKEIDKRTLYALLAKPLRRWEFLLGKFARAGADADGEYRGDGGGFISGAVLCEAFAAARGRGGAGGGVFHFAEAGAGGGAGDAVFVLHDAAAGDFVYGGIVRGGIVRP